MSRSTPTIIIRCDHPRCNHSITLAGNTRTEAEMQAYGETVGWQLGHKDLCPEHRTT